MRTSSDWNIGHPRWWSLTVAAAVGMSIGSGGWAMTHGSVAAAQSAPDDGQAAFVEAGCARCHSVAARDIEATVSERMQGPDLGVAAGEHDVEWVVDVVRGEIELDGRPHRAQFRGSDEQLRAIAEWLVGLEGSSPAARLEF